MYCSQCGEEAVGKFCYQCGCPIAGGESKGNVQPAEEILLLTKEDRVDLPSDWEAECRYDRIVGWPMIRDVIKWHASMATSGPSGEDYLKLFDKVVCSPVPLDRLANVLQPLYESWGIRTCKERNEWLPTHIGRSIASALCSFAKNSQALLSVQQHSSGCVLTAELPSSLCALKGRLIVSLAQYTGGTQVNAKTYIPGQVYDWGKSHRCLEQLGRDLVTELGLPATRSHAA